MAVTEVMSNEDTVELRILALAPTWIIQIRFSHRAIVDYCSGQLGISVFTMRAMSAPKSTILRLVLIVVCGPFT